MEDWVALVSPAAGLTAGRRADSASGERLGKRERRKLEREQRRLKRRAERARR